MAENYPDPVITIREMFVDAILELYLYFPMVMLKTSQVGASLWSVRDEGRLQEVDTMAHCLLDGTSNRPFEMWLDDDGDVEMGGSKY